MKDYIKFPDEILLVIDLVCILIYGMLFLTRPSISIFTIPLVYCVIRAFLYFSMAKITTRSLNLTGRVLKDNLRLSKRLIEARRDYLCLAKKVTAERKEEVKKLRTEVKELRKKKR